MADCFVGRQPILNEDNVVYGYELLYRAGPSNEVGDVNRTVATARVIVSTFVDIGLESIVGDSPAFLNVTEGFLHDPDLLVFAPEQVILSIPGELEPTPENHAAVEALRAKGYRMALNGYSYLAPSVAFLPQVEAVIIDALHADDQTLTEELQSLEGQKVLKIAKRVETMHRRDELQALGFQRFQGHFITKPEIVAGKRMPTNRAAVLRMVSRVSDPDLPLEELEKLISMDPALSLRLLRFVNSPLSGLTTEIESIRHAVVLVGRKTIKDWVMLLALSSLSNSVHELIVTAFIRARFCEQLAAEANLPGQDTYFTVGLFSVMDAMMATSMEDLVETLPFTAEIKSALTEGTGPHGRAVQCAEQLEFGLIDGCEFEPVSKDRISDIYLESLVWSDNVNKMMA